MDNKTLKEVIKNAQDSMKQWPEWMRKVAIFEKPERISNSRG